MKTIKFYTDGGKYVCWKKLKSFCDNWSECKSWINDGNSLVIDCYSISTFRGNLKASLLGID